MVGLPKVRIFPDCKKSKSKVVSVPPRRRQGERRYSFYSFLTSALDGGVWSASRSGRALAPGKGHPVPIVQEAGWAPEPVWIQRLEENPFASAGDRTSTLTWFFQYWIKWTLIPDGKKSRNSKTCGIFMYISIILCKIQHLNTRLLMPVLCCCVKYNLCHFSLYPVSSKQMLAGL
jgi:hypothetical protein